MKYRYVIQLLFEITVLLLNSRTLISTNRYGIFFDVWCQEDTSHLNNISEDSVGMYQE